MVAKHYQHDIEQLMGLNLAKIHMVAKLQPLTFVVWSRLNLAKIHMVAKHSLFRHSSLGGLNLAKIHMVAKLI